MLNSGQSWQEFVVDTLRVFLVSVAMLALTIYVSSRFDGPTLQIACVGPAEPVAEPGETLSCLNTSGTK
jgi:hypothetical protein